MKPNEALNVLNIESNALNRQLLEQVCHIFTDFIIYLILRYQLKNNSNTRNILLQTIRRKEDHFIYNQKSIERKSPWIGNYIVKRRKYLKNNSLYPNVRSPFDKSLYLYDILVTLINIYND